MQHVIIFPVMVEMHQVLLEIFTIFSVIKFGNSVILFLIPEQSQLLMSTKGLLKMIAIFTTILEK